jgi:hypothetical protein
MRGSTGCSGRNASTSNAQAGPASGAIAGRCLRVPVKSLVGDLLAAWADRDCLAIKVIVMLWQSQPNR